MLVNSIIFIAFFSACLVCIYKAGIFKKTQIAARLLMLIFFIKLSAGIGLNYVYLNYYADTENADIYKYFNDSKTLHNIAFEDANSFFKIFTGFDKNNPQLKQYYDRLSNWNEMDKNYQNIMNYHDSNYFNSHRFLIKLNTVFQFLSNSFLPTHTLFMCFLGFLGFVLIFISILPFFEQKYKYIAFLLIFLFPSVFIWSSTLLKETIVCLGFGIFIFSFFSEKNKHRKFFLYCLSFLILLFSKSYIVPVLCFSLFVQYLYQKTKYPFSISLAFLTTFILSAHYFIPQYSPLQIISSKMMQQQKIGHGGYFLSKVDQPDFHIFIEEPEFEKFQLDTSDLLHTTFTSNGKLFHYYILPAEMNYQLFKEGRKEPNIMKIGNMAGKYYLMMHFKKAGSYIDSPELNPDILSFVSFFPFAVKNVLLEPAFQGCQSLFCLLADAENIILLILIVILIFFRKKHINQFEFLPFLITFSVLCFLVIGYTNPIAGNIIRHRTIAILSLLIAIVIYTDWEKLILLSKKILNLNLLLNEKK